MRLAASDILPDDADAATLVGRVWIDTPVPGPRTFLLRAGMLVDLSALAPTMSDLIDLPDASALAPAHAGPQLCSLEEALDRGALLAPCDLQAVKAAGVTFAGSLIERVLEERARGDPVAASSLRAGLANALGGSLSEVVPGSGGAREAKRMLIAAGLWSQYLEVGIGPDPELFTKAQPMAAVGCGAVIALHPRSEWSCSEPEVVLAISSRGALSFDRGPGAARHCGGREPGVDQ